MVLKSAFLYHVSLGMSQIVDIVPVTEDDDEDDVEALLQGPLSTMDDTVKDNCAYISLSRTISLHCAGW